MFSSLNCNNVNINRVSGFDKYNSPIITLTETIKGKLEFKFRQIKDSTGTEVVSEGTFRTESPLNTKDQIEVNGKYRSFIQIQPQTSFSGATLYWIGWF